MTEPCGCKIDHAAVNPRLGLPKGHLIIYCPSHAQAGAMLAALEKIETRAKHRAEFAIFGDIARAAIHAARGGAASLQAQDREQLDRETDAAMDGHVPR
jgi:hypothetical protein